VVTTASTDAIVSVEMLARAINHGGGQRDVAIALGGEHGYLVNQIVYGVALGAIRKCRFAISGDAVTSCGDVMYMLATDPGETREQRDDHPYHDGELSCNAIRGALVTLGVAKDESWRRATCWIWS
jgi:hypothetical protein